MSISANIVSTFYQFSDLFILTLQHIENLDKGFLRFGKIPFIFLLASSKMKRYLNQVIKHQSFIFYR